MWHLYSLQPQPRNHKDVLQWVKSETNLHIHTIEYGEGKSREYQKYSQLGGKRKKITQKSDEKIKDKRKDNFSKGGSGL